MTERSSDGIRRLLSGVGWGAVALVGSMVMNLITSVTLARYLGSARFGHYSYVIWAAETGAVFAALGLSRPIARFIAAFRAEGNSRGARRLILQFVAAVATLGLLVGVPVALTNSWSLSAPLVWILLPLYMAVSAGSSVIIAASQGWMIYRPIALANLAGAAALLAGTLVVVLGKRSEDTQFLVVVSTLTLVLALQFVAVLAGLGAPAGQAWEKLSPQFKKYWAASAALAVIEVVIWQRSEIFFLERLSTPEQLGAYNAAFSVAARVIAVPQVLAPALLAQVAGQKDASDSSAMKSMYASITRVVALLCVPLFLMLAAASGVIGPMLFGSTFQIRAPMAILFACGVIPALAIPAAAVVYGTDQMSFVLRLGLVAAVVTILVDWWLIPQLGAVGAAIGNFAGQFVAVGGTTALNLWPRGFRFPVASSLRTFVSGLLGASVTLLACSFLAPLLGLGVGLVAGTLVYLLALTVMRPLEGNDMALLNPLVGYAPAGSRRLLERALGRMTRAA